MRTYRVAQHANAQSLLMLCYRSRRGEGVGQDGGVASSRTGWISCECSCSFLQSESSARVIGNSGQADKVRQYIVRRVLGRDYLKA